MTTDAPRDPASWAAALLEAERTGVPISPLSDAWPDVTVADAYAVQLEGRALRLQEGAELVGRKIGLTSQAMQDMLGVHEPDFGFITDRMLFESGATVPADRLIAPRVEAEIAFRLRQPVAPGAGIPEVLAATAEVAPALEIIDSRIADWRITIADTVADNASSACVVVGEFVPLGELELDLLEGTLIVTNPGGDEESVTGPGAAVLGHPAAAVAWLANALGTFGGERASAGEIVLPGSVARAIPVASGVVARASFPGLGAVEARFGDPRTG